MKKFPLFLLIVTALAAFAMTSSLYADAKAKPTPWVTFHTVIESITPDAISIRLRSGSKSYKIDKFTTVTFEGNDAKIADLKPGMKVSIIEGSDQTIAAEIHAQKPPIGGNPNDPVKTPAKGK